MKEPEVIDYSFVAPIQKDGAFATYLTAEGTPEYFRTGKAVKVGGTLDGHPFNATLMPSGSGPHWLPLKIALCKLIGKRDAGEEVSVHLDQRLS